jgi:regulator of sigma E protease
VAPGDDRREFDMTVLTSIIGFLFAVGLLVAIHEFGHYWVARRLGFKVLRFSVGFGRPLWRRTAGADGTEYVLGSLPLGGYVKMLDEREGPVPAHEQHRAYNRRPPLARIAVLSAGPAANFLFAVLALWAVYLAGVPGLRPYVGPVADETPAATAGLREEDLIVRVGDEAVQTWEAALLAMYRNVLNRGDVPVTLRSPDGATREAVLEPDVSLRELTRPGNLLPGLGLNVWMPRVPARLGEVMADSPASRAGLTAGDLVLRADDQPIGDWMDFVEFVRANPEAVVDLDIERDGRTLELQVAIGRAEANADVGFFGALPTALDEQSLARLRAEQRYGPVAAAGIAVAKTWEMSSLTLQLFVRMLTGQVSVENISGPINIATYAGDTIRSGAVDFVRFLAIVSVSLGLINLMPIPLLDGGQIVFTAIEGLRGRPLSERVQQLGQQVGLLAVLLLMSIAFYNDLTRHLG